jgi:hypothetical protein
MRASPARREDRTIRPTREVRSEMWIEMKRERRQRLLAMVRSYHRLTADEWIARIERH